MGTAAGMGVRIVERPHLVHVGSSFGLSFPQSGQKLLGINCAISGGLGMLPIEPPVLGPLGQVTAPHTFDGIDWMPGCIQDLSGTTRVLRMILPGLLAELRGSAIAN